MSTESFSRSDQDFRTWSLIKSAHNSLCTFDVNKSGAFLFNVPEIFHLNFETEELKCLYTPENAKSLNESVVMQIFRTTLDNDGKSTILAALKQQNSKQLNIAWLSVNLSDQTIFIKKELPVRLHLNENFMLEFLSSAEDSVYCYIYWHKKENDSTVYSVLKIDIAEEIELISDSIHLLGQWLPPNILNFELYFLPKHQLPDKILVAELNSEEYSFKQCSWITNRYPNLVSVRNCSARYRNFLVVYIFNTDNEIGEIWSLDIEKKVWNCVEHLNDHPLNNMATIQIFSDGLTFLHGNCANEKCAKCAHIYQFDISLSNSNLKVDVENCLGRGSYANVVQGTFRDNEKVAVKIFRDFRQNFSIAMNKRIVKAAVNEARKLKTLCHENIVKGYGFKIECHRILLFMELMQGTVRDKILRSELKRLDKDTALTIIEQALCGLVYLHTRRPKPIVHRDIKCANMLLDINEKVKLSDLGLSLEISVTEPETTMTTGSTDLSLAPNESLGTLHWQAPEVLEGQRYGRKADIWSIGCSLVEMLTGNPPYHTLKPLKFAVNVSNGSLSYNPEELIINVPSDVARFLEKTFRRVFKKPKSDQKNSNLSNTGPEIRPHSFELLANINTWSKNEDLEQVLQIILQSLKEDYSTRFQKVYPFSLPFTFDIENTWVSLALKEDSKYSQATEDYAKLLQRAFETVNMLIIEGDPATGKTSLMRRLAYEWAKGKIEWSNFDLIVYSEFREVREKSFESIADLLLCYSKNHLDNNEDFERLALLLNDKQFCKEHRILVLLDGYDESSLDKQCSELSMYLSAKTIRNAPLFNIVMTTRKGYLSNLRGRKGRFVYADVLGFTTNKQKTKYIYNHFSSKEETDSDENIAAVHRLLKMNENLDTLSETPLFLTFICLVHERIIDGTLLELYCNILMWLIDRHQQDFPDRDIPKLFDFKSDSDDKFKTIQDNYLQFPQLHCLGKMALKYLQKSVFQQSDCHQFNLKPILEQIGLLRKEEIYDKSLQLKTEFFFPHRTIQAFLAALYCFFSAEKTYEWFSPDCDFDTNKMNEYEKFLFRFALSDGMPITSARRQIYFEKITVLTLNFPFDPFSSAAGLNSKLLNLCFSKCVNVRMLILSCDYNDVVLSEPMNLSNMSQLNFFIIQYADILLKALLPPVQIAHQMQLMNERESFVLLPRNIMEIGFYQITFKSARQFSKTMKYFLKYLTDGSFIRFHQVCVKYGEHEDSFFTFGVPDRRWSENLICKSPQNVFAKQELNEALCYIKHADTLRIFHPKMTQGVFSFKDFVNLRKLSIEKLQILQDEGLFLSDLNVHTLEFMDCFFAAIIWFSFINCLSLETLKFEFCQFRNSATPGFAKLSAIYTLQFVNCEIDLITWQSITDEIEISSVRRLAITLDWLIEKQICEFLDRLKKCNRVEQIEITLPALSESFEEQLTIHLSRLVREMQGLKSIFFELRGKRMKDNNIEVIEKAGQERVADFLIAEQPG